MIFYFSGTGNSEYVARQLAERLGDNRLVAMGDALAHAQFSYTLSEGETVGWVFPVHSWGPAAVADEFARHVSLAGYSAANYCYVVATCGDECGEAVKMMRRALGSIKVNAAFSVQMPNNYILLPGFDVDSREVEQAKRNGAPERIDEVASAITRRWEVDDVVVGTLAAVKSRLVYRLFRRFYMSDKPFVAEPMLCNRCGKCARVCPVGNIEIGHDGAPRWKGKCAMCLSCIHRCPKRAIEYGKVSRSKGRYHF